MLVKRLYVGNLPEKISNGEVSSKFSHFGQIESVEVKTKNDATFAFISLSVEREDQVKECIEVLNNTKWRGNLMKVQLAKESFLDRLKREQEENKKKPQNNGNSNITEDDGAPKNKKQKTAANNATEKNQNGDSSGTKLQGKQGKKASSEDDSDSSDSDDDDEEERRSLPAFKGLLAYPELRTQNAMQDETITEKDTPDSAVAQKLVDIASSTSRARSNSRPTTQEVPARPPISVPSSVKWNVNKDAEAPSYDSLQNKLLAISGQANLHQTQDWSSPKTEKKEEMKSTPLNFKKQNSDMMRQKSLEARKSWNQSRSAIIKSSLSQVQVPANETKEPSKLSAALFGDGNGNDDDDDDDKNDFKIRPQFEGKSGEKVLELSSKFASYDKRFTLDQRFREDEPAGEERQEDTKVEKEKMFSILSDVLGSTVAPKLEAQPAAAQKKSVIIQRYDPDNEPQSSVVPEESIVSNGNSSAAVTTSAIPEEEPGVAAETEPKIATYNVAPNLKELFSSNNAGTFSLLSAFSSNTERDDDEVEGVHKEISSKPTNFWEGKKFKYDSSSDSENEDDIPTVVTDDVTQPEKKKKNKLDRFFFQKNDPRFQGVQEFFLQNDENMDDVLYRFNNGERTELKLICKSKIKNTKRKSEKRLETLRRLKRKMRNKRKSKYAPEGSNAVPIGSGKKSHKKVKK